MKILSKIKELKRRCNEDNTIIPLFGGIVLSKENKCDYCGRSPEKRIITKNRYGEDVYTVCCNRCFEEHREDLMAYEY